MFFSRPNIEPLGWDLACWPEASRIEHLDAITSDGRPVDFWFNNGWLTVSRGPVGASVDCDEMEEVLSVKISPSGIRDIEPEQVCDILGITVDGHRIDCSGIRIGSWGFDWSGRIACWESCHLMQTRDDPREFIQKLCDAFPGSMLIQTEWGAHARSRSRQIKFLMASDESVFLGVDPKREAVRKMLASEQGPEEKEPAFGYGIEFHRDDLVQTDTTGARYVYQNGARELGLKFDVVHHRRYRISLSYETDDPAAQAYTNTFLSVLHASFCRGLEVLNLQTGARITDDLQDPLDRWSYSVALRDEWREKSDRYFFVSRSAKGDDFGWEPGTFWGARPNERVMRPV